MSFCTVSTCSVLILRLSPVHTLQAIISVALRMFAGTAAIGVKMSNLENYLRQPTEKPDLPLKRKRKTHDILANNQFRTDSSFSIF